MKRSENTNTNTENRIWRRDECASDDMKRPQCKNNAAVLYKWRAPHVMIKRGSWEKQSFKDNNNIIINMLDA